MIKNLFVFQLKDEEEKKEKRMSIGLLFQEVIFVQEGLDLNTSALKAFVILFLPFLENKDIVF